MSRADNFKMELCIRRDIFWHRQAVDIFTWWSFYLDFKSKKYKQTNNTFVLTKEKQQRPARRFLPSFKLAHMFDENKNAVKVFNEMAEVYQQKYMNVDSYQESLDYFLNNLNSADSILDLACGPGNVLHYLFNKNNKLNLSGIDLSDEMIKLATLNVPNAKFEVSDCRDLNYSNSSYNAIVCNFLIPYLTEIEIQKLFTAVSNVLVPNGIFYLGFITEEQNRSEIVKSSKGHNVRMNYYSVDFVTRVLHDNKFTVGYSKSYISNNINQAQNDFIIVASK